MRRLSSILVVLAAAAPLWGCFVLDELDAGRAMMEKNSPKKPAKAEAAQAAEPEGGGQDAQAAARAWWAEARTLSTSPRGGDNAGDPNAVVRCELGGTGRFMRRSDCLSQGGRPASR